LFAGVYVAAFVGAYENLGLGAVMPSIAVELDHSYDITVYVTAFTTLSFISTIVVGGRLTRQNFLTLFTLLTVVQVSGLLLCRLATGNVQFLVGRALQGAGEGGLTVGIVFALTQLVRDGRRRQTALAGISVAWLSASALTPAVLMMLPERQAWRATMDILIVLASLSVLLLWAGRAVAPHGTEVAVGKEGNGEAGEQVKLTGTLLLAGAAVAVGAFSQTIALIPWKGAAAVTGLLLGAALTIGSLQGRLQGTRRIRDMSLLCALGIRAVVSTVYFTSLAFVPVVLSVIYRMSATAIGVLVATASVGWTCGAFLQSRLKDLSAARQLGVGLWLIGAMIALLAVAFHLRLGAWGCAPQLLVAGVGAGITNNALYGFISGTPALRGVSSVLSTAESIDTIWSTITISMVGVFVIGSFTSDTAHLRALVVTYGLLSLLSLLAGCAAFRFHRMFPVPRA
jgi:MFS family permease